MLRLERKLTSFLWEVARCLGTARLSMLRANQTDALGEIGASPFTRDFLRGSLPALDCSGTKLLAPLEIGSPRFSFPLIPSTSAPLAVSRPATLQFAYMGLPARSRSFEESTATAQAILGHGGDVGRYNCPSFDSARAQIIYISSFFLYIYNAFRTADATFCYALLSTYSLLSNIIKPDTVWMAFTAATSLFMDVVLILSQLPSKLPLQHSSA